MLRKQLGIFGAVLLFVLMFFWATFDGSQAEFVVLGDQTMVHLMGGDACSGGHGTICEKGEELQADNSTNPPFADCSDCNSPQRRYEPKISSCRRCDSGDIKHWKVSNMCRKRLSECETFGYPEGECSYNTWCSSEPKPPRLDDCDSQVYPTATCS